MNRKLIRVVLVTIVSIPFVICKYMRQFADEYPDIPFVQVPLAQLHSISIFQ